MSDASDKKVEDFIEDHRRELNDEAIKLLKEMDAEDQKRVLTAGPMKVWEDQRALFRHRERVQREREQELMERTQQDITKAATKESVESWIASNRKHISEAGTEELKSMDPKEQWRVMSAGPLGEDVDPVVIIETRAKQGRQLQDDLIKIMQAKKKAEEVKAEKNKLAQVKPPAPHIASKITDRFTRFVGKEVPESQRRCAGFAGEATWEEKAPLVGDCKGIGGVVEVLKPKYGCKRGDRMKVVGEKGGPTGMWLCEEGKSVPKLHEKEGGWRWVFKEAQEEPKKKDEAKKVADKGVPEKEEPKKDDPKKEEDKKKESSGKAEAELKKDKTRKRSRSIAANKTRKRSRSIAADKTRKLSRSISEDRSRSRDIKPKKLNGRRAASSRSCSRRPRGKRSISSRRPSPRRRGRAPSHSRSQSQDEKRSPARRRNGRARRPPSNSRSCSPPPPQRRRHK